MFLVCVELGEYTLLCKLKKKAKLNFCSGVARLGHTGAHALTTRSRAPPVQVYASELSVPIVSLSIAN